ncbi:uncharacterized protein LOC143059445 [Mytilus galloprovincialis]|uniref:uncharacterized protein LOC143059445 n=1 Tax=Mytilus galloprovincialis TaxID=29158 RepID=UPI003F7CBFFE
MTSQIFQALILAVTLTDMHQNEICQQMKEEMKCETTEQFIGVNHGENLILNCTCFNETNGQWIGPNKSPTLYTTADKLIPYTQGTELNPCLNRSKFRVFGGYNINKCNLQIMNFASDDEGLYKCQYIDALTVYVHAYNVVVISQMKCETTVQVMNVNHGENLILNCTCFNKTNGQWIGPNKSPTADKFIPYTQGTELNPNLNKSKYRVDGGYDINECNLQIMNFLSDDEGLYKCHYIDSLTVHVHSYNIVTINLDYHDAKIFNVEWVIPLAVIILVFLVVAVVTMRIRKGNRERNASQNEVIEEEDQADSVENRLYQSPAFLEMNNFRRQNRVTRNEFVSTSQIHADERYGGLNATERTRESGPNRRDILYPDTHAQINEINLNYAEVMFDVERSPRHCIIHGNDERTIYSDIDHLSRAEPLPSSSSESDDD